MLYGNETTLLAVPDNSAPSASCRFFRNKSARRRRWSTKVIAGVKCLKFAQAKRRLTMQHAAWRAAPLHGAACIPQAEATTGAASGRRRGAALLACLMQQ